MRYVKRVTLTVGFLILFLKGSGKTTTVLHLAKASTLNEQILLLTYNARLKIETREKAVHFSLHNLEVHSYHSFGVKV